MVSDTHLEPQPEKASFQYAFPLLPIQPDCTLTSELQVWMKFVFKLFPIDRCATATCPIIRQVVTQPVPQSTTQKEPEVKGLSQVQRGMLWAASTPAQPPVDTL